MGAWLNERQVHEPGRQLGRGSGNAAHAGLHSLSKPLVDSQIESLAQTHHLTREQVIEEIMLKPMPKRQFISLAELVGTVEFLLSDAARNISGQCVTIDGGWTAQ
jgi:NAD(P)-dependent dehydrogenase (short-subunit alcohol dehydrogenase family)